MICAENTQRILNIKNKDMENTKFTKGKWIQNGINGVHNENGNCIAISEGETREQLS